MNDRQADKSLRFNPGGVPREGQLFFERAELEKQLLDQTQRGAALLFGPTRCGKTTLLRRLADEIVRRGMRVVWVDFRVLLPKAQDSGRPSGADPGGTGSGLLAATSLALDLTQYRGLVEDPVATPSPAGLRTALERAIKETAAKSTERANDAEVVVFIDEVNNLLESENVAEWLEALTTPIGLGVRTAYATNWPLPTLPPLLRGVVPIHVPRAVPGEACVGDVSRALLAERARLQQNAEASARTGTQASIPPVITEGAADALAQHLVERTGRSAGPIQQLGQALGEGKIDASLRDDALDGALASLLQSTKGLRPSTQEQLSVSEPSLVLEALIWLERNASRPTPMSPTEREWPVLFALGWADLRGDLSAPILPLVYDAPWRAAEVTKLEGRLPYARRAFEWARSGALPATPHRATDLKALNGRHDLAPCEAGYRMALRRERRWGVFLALASAFGVTSAFGLAVVALMAAAVMAGFLVLGLAVLDEMNSTDADLGAEAEVADERARRLRAEAEVANERAGREHAEAVGAQERAARERAEADATAQHAARLRAEADARAQRAARLRAEAVGEAAEREVAQAEAEAQAAQEAAQAAEAQARAAEEATRTAEAEARVAQEAAQAAQAQAQAAQEAAGAAEAQARAAQEAARAAEAEAAEAAREAEAARAAQTAGRGPESTAVEPEPPHDPSTPSEMP